MNADYFEKNIAGEDLSFEEALELFELPLYELGYIADRIRARKCGNEVGFVVDRNINYTNVCVSKCKFCAFYARDGRDSYLLSHEEILARIEEAVDHGATQIMLQGGINPELGIEWFEGLFRKIKSKFDVDIHSLSPPEIVYLSRMERISIKEVISRLREAGLDSIPGGGAEILSDEVRLEISSKGTVDDWLRVMKTAHEIGMKTTATMMFGHIENERHIIEHLFRIRDLQKETGGFTAFIPWSFQPGNTELYGRIRKPAPPLRYLQILAVSRIVLHNIRNIQVSWLTQGMDVATLALSFGANDFGGVMLEENVVRATGKPFRPARVDEIVARIKSAGRVPYRRDTYYNVLEYY
ncbi:cyclic dehypoxanthinyl futalosine synthase [Geoglobus acetivorans]|uniref:Cyclic dehypoxanthine futalosine synthase n=1 Tax=Geoglobus acetivorans TaxID=565033 RepID=A0ABZ3H4L3_GEOAI|nr:dehypoxanthine futalosine cyclase [Geoglobus acetivorans]